MPQSLQRKPLTKPQEKPSDSSPGAKSSQPLLSASAHCPRQYEPSRTFWTPALFPAALNQDIPFETASATTAASGPVPSPAPSYCAVSDRVTIVTPWPAK